MIVGVLGGGQLGRMLALAGYPLGFRFKFLDPSSGEPAGQVAHRMAGTYEDRAALSHFADGLDVVTYEFENVPVESVQFLSERVPVFPPPAALEKAQDRLEEKRLFEHLGIPVPPFAPVESAASLRAAVDKIGLPAILKTRRFGYDGKGQWVIHRREDVVLPTDPPDGTPFILEKRVSFDRELSILSVRSRSGEIAFYPLVENQHRNGILHLSTAPAVVTPRLQLEAEGHARAVLESLQYVGVLAIEFFAQEGRLLANEMAPRVHNSGHWTIEGAECSQFENHLRAVAGLPLGSTAPRGHSVMLNLIGRLPPVADVLAIPGAHLHLYGKRPRAGRKLGHVTLCSEGAAEMEGRLSQLLALVSPE